MVCPIVVGCFVTHGIAPRLADRRAQKNRAFGATQRCTTCSCCGVAARLHDKNPLVGGWVAALLVAGSRIYSVLHVDLDLASRAVATLQLYMYMRSAVAVTTAAVAIRMRGSEKKG